MMTARRLRAKPSAKGAEMSRSEHPFTGEPVLVDRAEAREILSVTDATFARLCREGRFENMVCEGRHALYRSAELRAYRAQDGRRGAGRGSITNAGDKPKETAAKSVTQSSQMAADAGGGPAGELCPDQPVRAVGGHLIREGVTPAPVHSLASSGCGAWAGGT
jgi:hypothetical protein